MKFFVTLLAVIALGFCAAESRAGNCQAFFQVQQVQQVASYSAPVYVQSRAVYAAPIVQRQVVYQQPVIVKERIVVQRVVQKQRRFFRFRRH